MPGASNENPPWRPRTISFSCNRPGDQGISRGVYLLPVPLSPCKRLLFAPAHDPTCIPLFLLMKRLLLSVLAATCLTFVLPDTPAFAANGPESEMGESMEKISSAFRRVRRMVPNAENNAQTLELLATIRTESIAAGKHPPLMAAELPEAARPKFIEDFKKRMAEFITAVEKTEAAIKAGDNTAAAALVSDLASMQKAGHADFRKKDEKKG